MDSGKLLDENANKTKEIFEAIDKLEKASFSTKHKLLFLQKNKCRKK